MLGLWVNNSTLITMAIGSGSVSRQCLQFTEIIKSMEFSSIMTLQRAFLLNCHLLYITPLRMKLNMLLNWSIITQFLVCGTKVRNECNSYIPGLVWTLGTTQSHPSSSAAGQLPRIDASMGQQQASSHPSSPRPPSESPPGCPSLPPLSLRPLPKSPGAISLTPPFPTAAIPITG